MKSWNPLSGFCRRLSNELATFKGIYETAGFSDPYEHYLCRQMAIYLVTVALVYISLTAIHHSVLGYGLPLSLVLSLILAVDYSLAYMALVLYYPLYKRYSTSIRIDARLPYTLSYMASLAASRAGLGSIINMAYDVEDAREVKRELGALLGDVTVLGLDALSALDRRVRRCPSTMFSMFFAGLREVYITSGDLFNYISFMAQRVLEFKRQMLSKISNSMALIAEFYITLAVVTPLMIMLELVVIGMLGGTFMGVPVSVLMIAVAIFIGAASIATLIMLDGVLSRV